MKAVELADWTALVVIGLGVLWAVGRVLVALVAS